MSPTPPALSGPSPSPSGAATSGATVPTPGPIVPNANARLRVANVFVLNGQPRPVDVFAGFEAVPGQAPLVTVPFGGVSGYVGVNAEDGAVLVPQGQRSPDNPINVSVTPSDGEQDTFVIAGNLTVGQTAVRAIAIRETVPGEQGDPFPTGSPGEAVVQVFAGAVMGLTADADAATFYYGTPDGACLTGLDGTRGVAFGGDASMAFVAPAPSFQLVAWSDACGGTVVAGPVAIDASGGQVLVVPYGTGLTALTMLAIPIPRVVN